MTELFYYIRLPLNPILGRWLNFSIISGSHSIQSEGRWLNFSIISGSHSIQRPNCSIISGSLSIQSQGRRQSCSIYQVWLICIETQQLRLVKSKLSICKRTQLLKLAQKSGFVYCWYIVLEKRSIATKQIVWKLVLFRAVDRCCSTLKYLGVVTFVAQN